MTPQTDSMSEEQSAKLGPAGRRTERVALEIPIRVLSFGGSAGDFTEDTRTILVNRDGALIGLKHRVVPNDTIRIVNLENLFEADFRIVGAPRADEGNIAEWGVECLDKERTLWQIDFPPPIAPNSNQAGALLECLECNKQALRVLTLADVEVLDAAGSLEQLCDSCRELTSWAYADIQRRPKQAVAVPAEVAPAPAARWDGKDRRKHKRVALKLPVLVRTGNRGEELSKTEDISKGGFSTILSFELAVGTTVTAVCPFAEGTANITQRCEVRRRVVLYTGTKWLYGVRYLPA